MKNKHTDAADRRNEKNGCDVCMCENVLKSRTVEPNINKNMNIIIYDWPLYVCEYNGQQQKKLPTKYSTQFTLIRFIQIVSVIRKSYIVLL